MNYLTVFVAFCVITLAVKGASSAKRLVGINDPITIIQAFPDHPDYPNNFQSVHAITNKGEIYYVRGGDDRIFFQNDVPHPVTAMFTFTKDGGLLTKGDIYFGTTNGVYLRKSGAQNTTKLSFIEDSVNFIQDYPNQIDSPSYSGSVHVVTSKGDVFYIRGSDCNVFKQTDVPFPVTTMHTFSSDGENHKIGDIYFGTTMGVYFRKADEDAYRISEILDSVALIQEYPDNFPSVHVITDKGEIYHIKGGYESVVKQRNLPFPATKMYTYTKDCGVRKTGDIYFGTTDGVYLRKADQLKAERISGIQDDIQIIQEFPDTYCSVYVINSKGEIYYIRGQDGRGFIRIDVPFPVTTMHIFTSSGGNRKTGDIYFGTTDGIYLR